MKVCVYVTPFTLRNFFADDSTDDEFNSGSDDIAKFCILFRGVLTGDDFSDSGFCSACEFKN